MKPENIWPHVRLQIHSQFISAICTCIRLCVINFTNKFEMSAVRITHRFVSKIKRWDRINP